MMLRNSRLKRCILNLGRLHPSILPLDSMTLLMARMRSASSTMGFAEISVEPRTDEPRLIILHGVGGQGYGRDICQPGAGSYAEQKLDPVDSRKGDVDQERIRQRLSRVFQNSQSLMGIRTAFDIEQALEHCTNQFAIVLVILNQKNPLHFATPRKNPAPDRKRPFSTLCPAGRQAVERGQGLSPSKEKRPFSTAV